MRWHSFSCLVAAGLLLYALSTTAASAADLGWNCCANLEERVAELEGTMARKGNRKVRLTVSDWGAESAARSSAHPRPPHHFTSRATSSSGRSRSPRR
jgi:hypothetical protein